MEEKKLVCEKMNNILKKWKNYLPNSAFSQDFSKYKDVIDTLENQKIYVSALFRSTTPAVLFFKFINVPPVFPSYKNYVVFYLSYEVLYTINLDTYKMEKVNYTDYINTMETTVEILNGDLFTYGKCYTTLHKRETVNLKNIILDNIYNFADTRNTAARNVILDANQYGDTKIYFKIFYYY